VSLESQRDLLALKHELGCKNALYNSDLLLRHDLIKSFRSSQWLFDHEIFRAWNAHGTIRGTADALLTLKGNPGTGKSVLMKEAAKRADDSDSLMLHHYFDRTKDSKSTHFKGALDKFCTSLLYQLLSKLEPKPWTFLKDWGDLLRFNPGMLPWNLTQLQEAIREIIVGHEKRGSVKVRIFIDAIDESGNDVSTTQPTPALELLQWVDELLRSAAEAGADVRVCLSRPHFPAYGGLEPKTQSIVVEEHNGPAIEEFIVSALNRDEIFPGTRRLLYNRILRRCSNDFLWTTVVLENILARCDTLKEVELLKLVDNLPSTHKEMYEEALGTVKGSRATDTLRLLQMVWAARRPLSANEFRHALAFTNTFDYGSIAEWELSDAGIEEGSKFENYLRQESQGLIEIHHTSATENQVRFIHGSVANFLRDPSSILPTEALPWSQRCHLTLLTMSFHALDADASPKDQVAFNDYAAEHWIYHAKACGDLLHEVEQLPPFMSVCSKRKAKRTIERQIQAIKQSEAATHSHLLDEKESLLVLSATLGCTSLLQRHVSECKTCQDDINTYSDQYCKALQNAIIGCYTATTMWLLEKHCEAGIDVNELYGDMTLLYKASYFGPTEVVTFLLEKGADPCKRSLRGYEYPLHTAIELGSEDVVRILLQQKNVEIQFRLQRNGGHSPLHCAVKSRQPARRKLAVLRLLLKKAPRGVGILDLKNNAGVSVLELARQVGDGGGRGDEDVLDEIEDFYDEE
jgi:hypothetical protein